MFLFRGDLDSPEARKAFIEGARTGAVKVGLAKRAVSSHDSTRVKFGKPDTKQFLNRLLGFKLDIQQLLFDLFTHVHENEVREQRITGKLRDKNVDIAGVAKVVSKELVVDLGERGGKIEYNCIEVDRGTTFEEEWEAHQGEAEAPARFEPPFTAFQTRQECRSWECLDGHCTFDDGNVLLGCEGQKHRNW